MFFSGAIAFNSFLLNQLLMEFHRDQIYNIILESSPDLSWIFGSDYSFMLAYLILFMLIYFGLWLVILLTLFNTSLGFISFIKLSQSLGSEFNNFCQVVFLIPYSYFSSNLQVRFLFYIPIWKKDILCVYESYEHLIYANYSCPCIFFVF